jgi:hypothetical protein
VLIAPLPAQCYDSFSAFHKIDILHVRSKYLTVLLTSIPHLAKLCCKDRLRTPRHRYIRKSDVGIRDAGDRNILPVLGAKRNEKRATRLRSGQALRRSNVIDIFTFLRGCNVHVTTVILLAAMRMAEGAVSFNNRLNKGCSRGEQGETWRFMNRFNRGINGIKI